MYILQSPIENHTEGQTTGGVIIFSNNNKDITEIRGKNMNRVGSNLVTTITGKKTIEGITIEIRLEETGTMKDPQIRNTVTGTGMMPTKIGVIDKTTINFNQVRTKTEVIDRTTTNFNQVRTKTGVIEKIMINSNQVYTRIEIIGRITTNSNQVRTTNKSTTITITGIITRTNINKIRITNNPADMTDITIMIIKKTELRGFR